MKQIPRIGLTKIATSYLKYELLEPIIVIEKRAEKIKTKTGTKILIKEGMLAIGVLTSIPKVRLVRTTVFQDNL